MIYMPPETFSIYCCAILNLLTYLEYSTTLEEQEDYMIAYLDDILIFSLMVESHLEHMQKVHDSLMIHNIKLKPEKF